MPNKWRTITSLVHKFDFTVDEGKEQLSPSREKNKGTHLNREVSEGKFDTDHSNFSSYEGHKELRVGKIRGGPFRDAQGFGRLDAGSRAGFTSSSQGLHHHRPRYFNFPYFCTMCGLD